MMKLIERKIAEHQEISRKEAEFLLLEADDDQLSQLATSVRDRFHAPFEASYLIMAIINYTNVCVAMCDYCSFYRLPHQSGTYLLSFDEVCQKIEALRSYGGRLVGFNGGFHPKLTLDDYAELFGKIRRRYGAELEFYEMTVSEFMFSCKISKLSYAEGAQRLKAAGARWVTGGGSEILDDNFRKRHSPGKFTVDDYFAAQAAILNAGLGSTATMVIGFDESITERMNHLERLRQFQTSQGNRLASFLCWTYKPFHNALGGKEISTQEYLRWLAVARIYLTNFRNIRSSVLTKNEDALLGLQYGANDFDLPTEDEVTQKAGATISHEFERILNTAREVGYKVVKREPWPVAEGARV